MKLGMSVTYPDTSGLDYAMLVKLLRFHRAEIGESILAKIEGRTPVLTGALKEDEAYRAYGGSGGILQWYVGSEYQLAEWGREYAVYQEGPPLGTTGYTHGPYQMFEKVTTDDLDEIGEWATQVVQEGVDNAITMLPPTTP